MTWHRQNRRLTKEDYFRGTKYQKPRHEPKKPVLTVGKRYFVVQDDYGRIMWTKMAVAFGHAQQSTVDMLLERQEAIRILTKRFITLGGDVVVDTNDFSTNNVTVFIDDDIPPEKLDEAADLFAGHDVQMMTFGKDLRETGFIRLTA